MSPKFHGFAEKTALIYRQNSKVLKKARKKLILQVIQLTQGQNLHSNSYRCADHLSWSPWGSCAVAFSCSISHTLGARRDFSCWHRQWKNCTEWLKQGGDTCWHEFHSFMSVKWEWRFPHSSLFREVFFLDCLFSPARLGPPRAPCASCTGEGWWHTLSAWKKFLPLKCSATPYVRLGI